MPAGLDRKPPPDFLVIGAMRSGTTTLWSWLRQQPELFLPRKKELNFFSYDHMWDRGLAWYVGLFADASPYQLRGEVSPSYTNSRFSGQAARRIAETSPDVRLIYLLRDPQERTRSHFRLRVQTGQERKTLMEALSDPDSPYLHRSMYWRCIAPYTEIFPREQILVVRLDDLTDAEGIGWSAVLHHLGLSERPRPDIVKNVTANKRQLRAVTTWMRSRKMLRRYKRFPMPLRRLGRALLTRHNLRYEQQLADSRSPLPASVTDPLWEDLARLEEWLGRSLWSAKTE